MDRVNNFLVTLLLFILIFISCNDRNDYDTCTCQDSFKCDSTIGEWKNLGLNDENIVAVITHPCNDNIFFACSKFDFSSGKLGKIFKSTNCGTSWDTIFTGGGYGHPGLYSNIFFDKSNSNILYAISGRIIKSSNGGKNWYTSDDGIKIDWETNVVCFMQHTTTENVLFSGTTGFYGGKLYKSINYGKYWNEVKSINTLLKGGISCIQIDPNNNSIIYVGSTEGDLIKTTDGGKNWFYTGLKEHGIIYDLLVSPDSSNIIYTCLSKNGIMKSNDTGKTWMSYNNGFPNKFTSRKIIYNTFNNDICITASWFDSAGIYDMGGIYKLNRQSGIWTRIGINNTSSSYYYSSILISKCFNSMIVGSNGVYRINF